MSDVLCLHDLVCYMYSCKVGKPCIILNMLLILIIHTGSLICSPNVISTVY